MPSAPLLFLLLAACADAPDRAPSEPDPAPTALSTNQDAPAPAPEDCANGRDDDRDGRVDCEDGDCAAACAEDCGNGRDDDGDGLDDASDLACLDATPLSVASGTTITAWVTGGGAVTRTVAQRSSFTYSGSSTSRITETLSFASVQGSMQVRLPSASTSTACTWTAGPVAFTRQTRQTNTMFSATTTSTSVTPVSRGALAFSAGCPVGSSALPHTVSHAGGGHFPGAWTVGTVHHRWYMANMNWWGSTVSRETRRREDSGTQRTQFSTRRYQGTLGSGSPVAFTVP